MNDVTECKFDWRLNCDVTSEWSIHPSIRPSVHQPNSQLSHTSGVSMLLQDYREILGSNTLNLIISTWISENFWLLQATQELALCIC